VIYSLTKVFKQIDGFIRSFISNTVLIFVFFFFITPLGLFFKVIGKDPLAKSFDKNLSSYKTPIDKDDHVERMNLPF
jgi:hypothetical protein